MILMLTICLIWIIVNFPAIIIANEETTDFIEIEGYEGDFKFIDKPHIDIKYVPNNEDLITFYFRIRRLNESKEGRFRIYIGGKMKEKVMGSWNVKHSHSYGNNRYYIIDFQEGNEALFFQTFYCNLFADKTGNVKLKLMISDYSGNLIDGVKINFVGLDEFDIENVSPAPNYIGPYRVSFIHKSKSEPYFGGYVVKGDNENIKQYIKRIEFYSGVMIAILVSSIVGLVIEVIKDIKGKFD